jgi:hypothetical protein
MWTQSATAALLVGCGFLNLAGSMRMARAEAPEGPLFKPRLLAAAEVPLPDCIAESEYVVVGKVVGVEDKTVTASPYPGSPDKVVYQVVTVKPSEVLRGDPAVKEIRLGFIPRESYKLDVSGVPTPGVPWAQTTVFKVGQEGLLFLKKHHQESFQVQFAPFQGFITKEDADFRKTADHARKLAGLLKDPTAALKTDNAANRFLAATMLIHAYRPYEVKGQELRETPVDAAVSKLLLKALADADWRDEADHPLDGMYPPHPYRLFQRLGVTKADGYDPPAKADQQTTFNATQKWLQDNEGKYAVKRWEAKGK